MAFGTGQSQVNPLQLAQLLAPQSRVPLSVPGAGIANAGTDIARAFMMRQLMAQQGAREQARQNARTSTMRQLAEALGGAPATAATSPPPVASAGPGAGPGSEIASTELGATAAPAPAPTLGSTRENFARILMGSGDQSLQNLGKQMAAQPGQQGQGFVNFFNPDTGERQAVPQGSQAAADLASQGFLRGDPAASKLLSPEEFEQQARLRQLGRTSINVDTGAKSSQFGSPPKNMVWLRGEDNRHVMEAVRDDQGNVIGYSPKAVPISGGPEEAKRLAAQKESEAAVEAAETAQRQNVTRGNVVLDEISIIRDALGRGGLPSTGLGGALASAVPGTNAFRVAGALESIGSAISLDQLRQLREGSATGSSGLGQVTEKEHAILQNALGALRQADDIDVFNRRLARVESAFEDAVYGPSGRFANMPDDQFYAVNVANLSESGRQQYISETDKRRSRMGGQATGTPQRIRYDAEGNRVQ